MDPPPHPRRRTRPLILLSAGVALLVLFAFLAIGVKHKRVLVETDALCRDVLHAHARESPEVAAIFAGITELASPRALWAEAAAVALVLAVLRRWRAAAVWSLAFAGWALVPLLKTWIGRARPVFEYPLLTERSPSFPSSHAVGAAIVFGMLTYLCIKAKPQRWISFVTLFGSVIGLIGFSRLYLGAHWLSDVLAGQCFGLGWVLVWAAVAEALDKPKAS